MVRWRNVVGPLVLAITLPAAAAAQVVDAGARADLGRILVPGKAYITLTGGGAFVDDLDERPSGVNLSARFQPGWLASLAAGTCVGESAVRAEIEGGYLAARIDELDMPGFTVLDVTGDICGAIVMLNGYYDVPLTDVLDAYVGGGVGLAYVDVDVDGDIVGAGTVAADDDSRGEYAWQLKAGLAVRLNEAVDLTVGYRLLDIDLAEDTHVHIAELGLRYRF